MSHSNEVGLDIAGKFFLRRSIGEKRSEVNEVNIEEKRLYILFALIRSESGNISREKLEQLSNCIYFKDVDIDHYLKDIKMKGYINMENKEEEWYFSYGWRFIIEYSDVFTTERLIES